MGSNIVIVDFDETLALSVSSLVANPWSWDGPDFIPEITHWEIDHFYTKEERQRMWARFRTRKFLMTVPAVEGAAKALREMSEVGILVVVVTDRDPSTRNDVRDWLAMKGFPEPYAIRHTDDVYTKQHVVSLMMNWGFIIHGIFDDAPHHLTAYADLGGDFPIYAPVYRYNQHAIDGTRVRPLTTWKEVADGIIRRYTEA